MPVTHHCGKSPVALFVTVDFCVQRAKIKAIISKAATSAYTGSEFSAGKVIASNTTSTKELMKMWEYETEKGP
ncbi:unnamed protein product [Lepidochelys kempii]